MEEFDRAEAGELLEHLGDETARCILHALSDGRLSANELARRCDVSGSTVYRKLAALTAYDLVEAETRIEHDGNHVTVYLAVVDRIDVRFIPGEDVVVNAVRRRPVDQFKDLWEGLKER